jgi:hypothetical protein
MWLGKCYDCFFALAEIAHVLLASRMLLTFFFPFYSFQRMSSRTGQSPCNRLVTCIEANEMGYCVVNTCSRCNYYLQNRNLNNKALILPRSQLSKLWQCTSLHKVGDLYHSQCTQMPYQPI